MDWIILITIIIAWTDINSGLRILVENQQTITDNQKKLNNPK